MSGIEEIQAAEATLEKMQDALAAVQVGLERAEAVAVAAEEAKKRSEQLLKFALGFVGISILMTVTSRRKPKSRLPNLNLPRVLHASAPSIRCRV